MPREGIHYEEVAPVCDRLAAEGQTPTVRKLRAELGTGSNSTLLAHLNQWQEQRREAARAEVTLPTALVDVVQQALVAAAATARAELQAELNESRAKLGEVEELLSAGEEESARLRNELAQTREHAEAQVRELEQALAAERSKVETLQVDLERAREQTQHALTGQETARIEAAKAGLEVKRADKAAERAEALATRQMETLDSLKAELAEAEKRAAVAEAHSEEQQKAVTKLEVELGEARGELARTREHGAGEAKELRQELGACESARREAETCAARAEAEKDALAARVAELEGTRTR